MSKVEITLHDILWSLRRHLVWIILVTIVFGVGSWFYTTNYVTPVYNATMRFSIRASIRSNDSYSANEYTADTRLATLCCELMNSDQLTQRVSEELGSALPASAIKGMIAAAAGTDAPILRVNVTASDADRVYQVAQAIATVAPIIIPEIAGAGELFLTDAPERPVTPLVPVVSNNVAFALLLGLLLSCGVVILIAVMDTTVWREEDLERAFDIPVLGSVPNMNTSTTSNSRRN